MNICFEGLKNHATERFRIVLTSSVTLPEFDDKNQCCGSGSGIFLTWIRDPKSGINIPNPQHWYKFVSSDPLLVKIVYLEKVVKVSCMVPVDDRFK